MKNQYFADVGDFGKYGLLTALSSDTLKLGVNWYLTSDDTKTDGNHIDYFKKPDFLACDEELHRFLNECIVENRRNVSEIKKLVRFHRATFHDELLHVEDIPALSEEGRRKREMKRDQWFENSLSTLSDCDLVFCDPDNGIETKSLSKAGKNSVKYVYTDEISKMVENGFSLAIYNHRDRSPDSVYKSRIREIYQCVSHRTKMRVLRFNRYSVRDYIILMQVEHSEVIEQHLDSFLGCSAWGKHFEEITV